MDPASIEGTLPHLAHPLRVQGRILGEHARLLAEAAEVVAVIRQEYRSLSAVQLAQDEQLVALTTLVHALPNPGSRAVSDREPHLATPSPYDGTIALCREFLMQCGYVFELQPSMYSTAAACIAYMANLTTGRARRWIMAGREGAAPYMQDYRAFVAEFKTIFDHDANNQDAAAALSALQQGSDSVADYATEFCILATRCGLNESALYSAFRCGLGEAMKDALSGRESPGTLNQLISQSIALDERYRECKRERQHQQQVSSKPPLPAPPSQFRSIPVVSRPQNPTGEEPRQLGRVCSPAHTIASCPAASSGAYYPGTPPRGVDSPAPGYRVSRLINPLSLTNAAKFSATLAWQEQRLTMPVLIDSGADESFVDHRYAQEARLPLVLLEKPLSAFALDGHPMGPCHPSDSAPHSHGVREPRREHPPLRHPLPRHPVHSGTPLAGTPHPPRLLEDREHSRLEYHLPRPLPPGRPDTLPGRTPPPYTHRPVHYPSGIPRLRRGLQ